MCASRTKKLYNVATCTRDSNNHKKWYLEMQQIMKTRSHPVDIGKNLSMKIGDRRIPLDEAVSMERSLLPRSYLFGGNNNIIPLHRDDSLLELSRKEWIERQLETGNR